MIDGFRQLLTWSASEPGRNERGGELLSQFVRWQQRRKGRALLHGMPDYLLKDIGISRGEIDQEARGQREARSNRRSQ